MARLRVEFALSVLLVLLPAVCWGICVEDGQYPVRSLALNCSGSAYESYCCATPREAVNDSACVPRPWLNEACQGGYFASDNGTQPCPDGFYCPENALCMVKCSLGAYCKAPVGVPGRNSTGTCSLKTPGQCCMPYSGTERRLGSPGTGVGIQCGGANDNRPCEEGYYCSSPVEKEMCPESFYCREGSNKPQACPSLSSCGHGAAAPKVNAFSLVLCILLGLVLLAFVIAFQRRHKIREMIIAYLLQDQASYAKSRARSPTEDSGQAAADTLDNYIAEDGRVLPTYHIEHGRKGSDGARAGGQISPVDDVEDSGRRNLPRISDIRVSSTRSRLTNTRTEILMWMAGLPRHPCPAAGGGDAVDGMQERMAGCEQFTKPKAFTLHIEFTDLSLTPDGRKKNIVDNVSGSIEPGKLTAIMGGSGTGKTSLLNSLCGKAYYAKRTGKLMINGKEVDGIDEFRSVVGFVPQDDVMHTDLTVHEVLMYQALLRLPRSWTYKERHDRVCQLEQLLGLRHIASSVIGSQSVSQKISGGQRKRVNIGMELVADPTMLFLDEPTSGLDSVTSREVVELLKFVASKGNLTVALVIHQPRYDIFEQFDDIILMESGGRIAFQGSPAEAETFFKSIDYDDRKPYTNPADYYLDCIDSRLEHVEYRLTEGYAKGLDTVADMWEAKQKDHRRLPPPFPTTGFKAVVKPYAVVQFFYLLRRFFLLTLRTWWVFALDLFLVVLAGGVLGALFSQITLKRLLVANVMTGLSVGLTGMISALRPFGTAETRPLFWRESSVGINRVAYFCSVVVGNIPAIILYPIFFLSFYYSLTAPRASFGSFYAIFLFTYWAVFGIGYMFSTVFHPDNSKMAAVVIGLIASAVCGTATTTICKLDKYTFIGPLVYSISYSKWFSEGLFEVEANQHPPVLSYNVQLLAGLNDYPLNNFGVCIGVLFAIGVVCRIIALLLLIFMHRGQQK